MNVRNTQRTNGQDSTTTEAGESRGRTADRAVLPSQAPDGILVSGQSALQAGVAGHDDRGTNRNRTTGEGEGGSVTEEPPRKCLAWWKLFPALAELVSEQHPNGPGVYFLVRADQIVYIGLSDFPFKRVWDHKHQNKQFDYAVFLAVADPNELPLVEQRWIDLIRPPHNQQCNPDYDPTIPSWGPPISTKFAKRSYRLPHAFDSLVEQCAEGMSMMPKTIVIYAVRDYLIAKGYLSEAAAKLR